MSNPYNQEKAVVKTQKKPVPRSRRKTTLNTLALIQNAKHDSSENEDSDIPFPVDRSADLVPFEIYADAIPPARMTTSGEASIPNSGPQMVSDPKKRKASPSEEVTRNKPAARAVEESSEDEALGISGQSESGQIVHFPNEKEIQQQVSIREAGPKLHLKINARYAHEFLLVILCYHTDFFAE